MEPPERSQGRESTEKDEQGQKKSQQGSMFPPALGNVKSNLALTVCGFFFICWAERKEKF